MAIFLSPQVEKVFKRRNPDDGKILWKDSAFNINNLIRGVTNPFPGAFTFYKNHKIIIWESRIDYTKKGKSTKTFGYFYKDRHYYKVITGKGILTIIKMSKNYILPNEGIFKLK